MVDLPQHGGEGKEKYKGHKSDSSLPQHGGEGKNLGKGKDQGLLNPTAEKDYCGPGRYLKSE